MPRQSHRLRSRLSFFGEHERVLGEATEHSPRFDFWPQIAYQDFRFCLSSNIRSRIKRSNENHDPPRRIVAKGFKFLYDHHDPAYTYTLADYRDCEAR